MTIKERLKELDEARQMRQLWQERVDFLSKPVITDFSIIDELWKVTAKGKGVRQRKAFVFVVLFFFSPSKLSGGKIIRPVMRRLSAVTGCTKSVLSHNCEDLVIQYSLYKDFRNSVRVIVDELIEMLRTRGVSDDILNMYL